MDDGIHEEAVSPTAEAAVASSVPAGTVMSASRAATFREQLNEFHKRNADMVELLGREREVHKQSQKKKDKEIHRLRERIAQQQRVIDDSHAREMKLLLAQEVAAREGVAGAECAWRRAIQMDFVHSYRLIGLNRLQEASKRNAELQEHVNTLEIKGFALEEEVVRLRGELSHGSRKQGASTAEIVQLQSDCVILNEQMADLRREHAKEFDEAAAEHEKALRAHHRTAKEITDKNQRSIVGLAEQLGRESIVNKWFAFFSDQLDKIVYHAGRVPLALEAQGVGAMVMGALAGKAPQDISPLSSPHVSAVPSVADGRRPGVEDPFSALPTQEEELERERKEATLRKYFQEGEMRILAERVLLEQRERDMAVRALQGEAELTLSHLERVLKQKESALRRISQLFADNTDLKTRLAAKTEENEALQDVKVKSEKKLAEVRKINYDLKQQVVRLKGELVEANDHPLARRGGSRPHRDSIVSAPIPERSKSPEAKHRKAPVFPRDSSGAAPTTDRGDEANTCGLASSASTITSHPTGGTTEGTATELAQTTNNIPLAVPGTPIDRRGGGSGGGVGAAGDKAVTEGDDSLLCPSGTLQRPSAPPSLASFRVLKIKDRTPEGSVDTTLRKNLFNARRELKKESAEKDKAVHEARELRLENETLKQRLKQQVAKFKRQASFQGDMATLRADASKRDLADLSRSSAKPPAAASATRADSMSPVLQLPTVPLNSEVGSAGAGGSDSVTGMDLTSVSVPNLSMLERPQQQGSSSMVKDSGSPGGSVFGRLTVPASTSHADLSRGNQSAQSFALSDSQPLAQQQHHQQQHESRLGRRRSSCPAPAPGTLLAVPTPSKPTRSTSPPPKPQQHHQHHQQPQPQQQPRDSAFPTEQTTESRAFSTHRVEFLRGLLAAKEEEVRRLTAELSLAHARVKASAQKVAELDADLVLQRVLSPGQANSAAQQGSPSAARVRALRRAGGHSPDQQQGVPPPCLDGDGGGDDGGGAAAGLSDSVDFGAGAHGTADDDDHAATADVLAARLKAAKYENRQLLAALEAGREEVAQLREQLANAAPVVDEAGRAFGSPERELEYHLQRASREELRGMLLVADEERAAANVEAETLRGQLKELDMKLASHRAESADLTGQARQAEDNLAQMRDRHEELQAYHALCEDTIATLRKEIADLAAENRALVDEREETTRREADASCEVNAIILERGLEKTRYNAIINDLEKKVERAESCQAELERLKREAEERESEEITALTEKNELLQQQLKALRYRVQQLQQAADAQAQRLASDGQTQTTPREQPREMPAAAMMVAPQSTASYPTPNEPALALPTPLAGWNGAGNGTANAAGGTPGPFQAVFANQDSMLPPPPGISEHGSGGWGLPARDVGGSGSGVSDAVPPTPSGGAAHTASTAEGERHSIFDLEEVERGVDAGGVPPPAAGAAAGYKGAMGLAMASPSAMVYYGGMPMHTAATPARSDAGGPPSARRGNPLSVVKMDAVVQCDLAAAEAPMRVVERVVEKFVEIPAACTQCAEVRARYEQLLEGSQKEKQGFFRRERVVEKRHAQELCELQVELDALRDMNARMKATHNKEVVELRLNAERLSARADGRQAKIRDLERQVRELRPEHESIVTEPDGRRRCLTCGRNVPRG